MKLGCQPEPCTMRRTLFLVWGRGAVRLERRFMDIADVFFWKVMLASLESEALLTRWACFLTLLPSLRWSDSLKARCDSRLLPCREFQGGASDPVLRPGGWSSSWTRFLTCPLCCYVRCHGPDSVENCLEVCSRCSSTRSSCVEGRSWWFGGAEDH